MFSVDKDYREALKEEFAERRDRNPSYSLRAYARDLSLPFSRLHEMLSYKKGLSVESAQRIANSLEISSREKDIFMTQIEALHSRNRLNRGLAQSRLEKMRREREVSELQEDVFRMIKDWYHFAILELVGTENFQSSHAWIAKRLNISLVETELAVSRLLNLGLLKEESDSKKQKRWVATDDFTATTSGIPSEAIRKNHEQMLKKAHLALSEQAVRERDFSSLTLSFNDNEMEAAKDMIKRFRREFNSRFSGSKNRNRVYFLGMQFFSLDKSEV
ncbi:MAG: DUF4423 domain-containing protein [Pseudobdellovibrionaceae bacterium]